MGTGSPKATTRGLLDTPYLGSTRLNWPEDEQLASTKHAPTAATVRAARPTASEFRIPMRPNYHPDGRVPTLQVSNRRQSRCGPPHPHQEMNISQGERGGNGDNPGVVNQWFLFGGAFSTAGGRLPRHASGTSAPAACPRSTSQPIHTCLANPTSRCTVHKERLVAIRKAWRQKLPRRRQGSAARSLQKP